MFYVVASTAVVTIIVAVIAWNIGMAEKLWEHTLGLLNSQL